MGIGDFVKDITPDVVEDAVEDGVEWVGNRVEDAGEWTADRLEDVGWESGADWVRDTSRSVANRMGAEVDELDLGQTEDKTRLVYGSPSKLRSTASHLTDLGAAFTTVGEGLKGADSSDLKGEGADAFREKVATQPPKWFKASDALEKAAKALDSFASTVEWAQGQAQTAIDLWKAGTKASEEAAEAHKTKVDTFNKAVDAYNARPAEDRDPSSLPARPGEFSDPGTARMQRAQELLAEARKQRNEAAERARSAVTAARDAAPPKPSYGKQVTDGLGELEVIGTHVGAGVIKGTAGLLSFVRSVNPLDPYNITHPAEYLLSLNNTAAGLVQVANDPWGTGKRMVDGFMKDPAEGFGRLLPDVALTVATGGAGAGVKGLRVLKEGADLAADAGKGRGAVDGSPPGTHDRGDGTKPTKGTDPVDLATGRMFLPQTDVALPGTLPLVFTRRVESGYRVGRFFGPSWSSTVDERLEIDPVGVVHVTADGMLLTYPHPAPGVATLPETGTGRARLARDERGDYTVTDPVSGLVRHFTAPGAGGGAVGGEEDGDAWLTQISDRNGNTISVDRAGDGTPLALVHSGGYHLTLSTAEGRVTGLGLLDGDTVHPVRTYGYSGGNLTAVTKPSGATLTFAYDDEQRVIAWIDSNGSRYDYVYDGQDRCIAEGGEAGHFQLTLTYSSPDPATGHRTTTLTTAAGHRTRHVIDQRCRVVATTDALGHTTRFTYDERGNQTGRTDALGHTTSLDYDEFGQLTAVTWPDGAVRRAEYDEDGYPTRFVHPDGTSWRQEYDERGNRVRVIDEAGHATHYAYNPQGGLASITDPLGAVTGVRCDPAGLPLEISDPLGHRDHYERDPFGRPLSVTNPLGAATRYTWSPDGELASRIGPDGSAESWTYDGEGNLLSRIDPLGQTTRFEYTHFDLLRARTGPDGTRYEFRHDAELRLTEVTNPLGQRWGYAYDAAGRLISESDFDDRELRYELDAVGRLSRRTGVLGGGISFTRDPLGRVVRKDAGGQITTYAHDANGRLVRATGPDGELLHHYDRRGLLTTVMADGHVSTYRYDSLGRRIQRTTPTGKRTAYGYDQAGRPTELTSGEQRITFAHDAAGRERSRSFGEFLAVDSTWDETGRLTEQLLTHDSRTLNRRAYTYRADGHLTAIEDESRGPSRFELDAVGRVTTVSAPGWQESYVYDVAGNQSAASWPSAHPGHEATGARAYDGTVLTRAGNVRYEHDALGRVTLRQKTRLSRKPDSWHYTWDTENRLTAVTTPDGTRWRYRYDPLGRRTAKQRLADDGETVVEETRFAWDGTVLCEQTTSSPELPQPVTITWDHQGVRPLAQTERIGAAGSPQEIVDQRFYAIATDLIGTPTELVGEQGEIAWRTRTTLWGTTTWNRDATTYTPLRFPGQYHDPETGLHYNYFRHYDPECARYITPDPLGLSPAPNPNAYVHNPHKGIDPIGLAPCLPREGRPMDSFLASGATVRHTETATAIGDDANTLQNLLRSRGAAGHDLIVHGDTDGNFRVDGMITHPQQIADAVLENPHYKGGPIQMVTCHGGVAAARELSEILGVEVRHASPHMVDIDPDTGLVREWPDGPLGDPIVK
ncbi:putative T7SS-secreted protein [Streptomyces sp. NPDC057638]|uniref:putative T7SS-secreted protein n=1 Tax=Streptomyces sp. NPDC057638 TaxID=3346190 RepID=UPI0036858AAD